MTNGNHHMDTKENIFWLKWAESLFYEGIKFAHGMPMQYMQNLLSLVLLCLITLLACSQVSTAQAQAPVPPQARALPRSVIRHYWKGNYLRVKADYEQLSQQASTPLSAEAKLYYASSLYALADKQQAYERYREAFSELDESRVEVRFIAEYGLLCLYAGDFGQGEKLITRVLTQLSDPDSIVYLSTALSWAKQNASYKDLPLLDYVWEAHNLSMLNSSEMDYCVFRHKGRLYYISRREPQRGLAPEDQLPYEALYVASLIDTTIRPVGFFSKYHEGIAGFVGDTLIVYRSSRRRGDFYIAYPKEGGAWKEPILWKAFPNSRKGSEDAIAEDRKTGSFIFSSDRKGTIGGKDLWVVRRLPDGKLSEPENITELNTPFDEDSPFLVEDTLYFASNRPQSLGGYDLYRSVRQGTRWSPPERLPKPFNSPAHDIYLTWLHPDSAILSSDRLGGLGKMDIYLVVKKRLPPPAEPPITRTYRLEGRAYDLKTGQPVLAQVRLIQNQNEVVRTETQPDGTFSQEKPGAGLYLLIATAPGYALFMEKVEIPDTADWTHDIPLVSIAELRRIRFPRVHFDFDKHSLRMEAPKSLDTVLTILQTYPTLIVEVQGHTDSIGSMAYNQRLGQRRAETVRQYLIEKGIPGTRLKARSYGEEAPASPNSTPYYRFLNRRVEFRIIESTEDLPDISE